MDIKYRNRYESTDRLYAAIKLLTEPEAGQTFVLRVRKPSELTHTQLTRVVRLVLDVFEADGTTLCNSIVKDLPWSMAKALKHYGPETRIIK